jgi:hypothetical protein
MSHIRKNGLVKKKVKKILITNEIWSFIEKVIEIDNFFPSNYRVNDMIIKNNTKENTYNGLMIMPMMMKVVKY